MVALTMTVSTSWVLSLVVGLQPHAAWSNTYPRTAEAIARQATLHPVFQGSDGPERSAALLVAIARYESNFRIDAGGDCDLSDPKTGLCAKGHEKTASSLGLFQINKSNFVWLGVTREQMTTDPDVQAATALRVIQQSFKNCAGKPLIERLGWYHYGHEGCAESAEGRTRMRLAIKLFSEHPPPAEVASVTPG